MLNRYHAIGRLIMNLRNGRFLIEEGFEAELMDEFRQVTLWLASDWLRKTDGWEYCLDFHYAEADRLRGFVDFNAHKPNVTLRMLMHEQLTEQMRRLDMMINGTEGNRDWILEAE